MGHLVLSQAKCMGAFLHENVAHVETHQLEFNTRLGTACFDPLSLTHTHSLTGGMQQAIGQSRVVSVAQTQLAGGWWDAYISTNTGLRLWTEGLDSGLRERISQWWRSQHSECCMRLLAWFCFDCLNGSKGIALFVCRALFTLLP